MLAAARLSGERAPSSSIRAGRKVPLPFTSSLIAAYSDAMVIAKTLRRTASKRRRGKQRLISLPSDGREEHVASEQPTVLLRVREPLRMGGHARTRAERRDRRADHAPRPCDFAQQRMAVREPDDRGAI